jgi:hypothetical protein
VPGLTRGQGRPALAAPLGVESSNDRPPGRRGCRVGARGRVHAAQGWGERRGEGATTTQQK